MMEENKERTVAFCRRLLCAVAVFYNNTSLSTFQIKQNKQNFNGTVSYVCVCGVNVRVDLLKLFRSVSCFYRLKARAQLQS